MKHCETDVASRDRGRFLRFSARVVGLQQKLEWTKASVSWLKPFELTCFHRKTQGGTGHTAASSFLVATKVLGDASTALFGVTNVIV